MYPSTTLARHSLSPDSQRRRLPASPDNRNHYETIDEVKARAVSPPEYKTRAVDSRANGVRYDETPESQVVHYVTSPCRV